MRNVDVEQKKLLFGDGTAQVLKQSPGFVKGVWRIAADTGL
jgi:hypothetical protein